MSTYETDFIKVTLPVPGTEQDQWAQILNTALEGYDRLIHRGRQSTHTIPHESKLLGYKNELALAQSSSPLNLDSGTGRISIRVNSGTDTEGTITVSGSSYNVFTDTLVPVAENLNIDGTGEYVTSNVFSGPITIEYSNLSISSYDVLYFDLWNNRSNQFSVVYWEVHGTCKNVAASLVYSLVRVNTSSGKFVGQTIGTVTLAAPSGSTLNLYKGSTLLTSTLNPQYEGLYPMFTMSDPSHWENINLILGIEER